MKRVRTGCIGCKEDILGIGECEIRQENESVRSK